MNGLIKKELQHRNNPYQMQRCTCHHKQMPDRMIVTNGIIAIVKVGTDRVRYAAAKKI